ncbi:MAG: sulfur carrier protein ThiS [Elusimicrobiales bacterium]|nr:sulfur carrier protein ThiS [Elusimicrobiales bacterium]
MVTVNGKKVKNPKKIINIIGKNKNINSICVLVNGKIIPKEKWEKVKLKDGDKIEIVGFVGGG